MKRLITLAVALFALCSLGVSAQVLTNKSVIDMLKLGLSEEVIVAKIQSSTAEFTTEIEDLTALKEAGATDKIILAVLDKTASDTQKEVEATELVECHAPGIYVIQEGGELQITPSLLSNTKVKGAFASALFTAGLAPMKAVREMKGNHSSEVIYTSTPTFYFYFRQDPDTGATGLSLPVDKSVDTTSPLNYLLVKMKKVGSKRNVEIERGNVLNERSSLSGYDSRNTVPLHYENFGQGDFKVIPSAPLEDGEYCFYMWLNGGETMCSVAWDFAIQTK